MKINFLGFNEDTTLKEIVDAIDNDPNLKDMLNKDLEKRKVYYAIAAWCDLSSNIGWSFGVTEATLSSQSAIYIKGNGIEKKKQRGMPKPYNGCLKKEMRLEDLVKGLNNNTIQIPWGQNDIDNAVDLKDEDVKRIKLKYKEKFLKIICPQIIVVDVEANSKLNSNELKVNIFDNSKCVIFFGPPGTGKTRKAKIEAIRLVTDKNETESPDPDALNKAKWIINGREENDEINKELKKYSGRICLVQFHPSYSYNDFIETIDMTKLEENKASGASGFDDRIFKKFAKRAEEAKNSSELKNNIEENSQSQIPKFVLIIDEINRANVSEVLGELLYGLEYRGTNITTGISNSEFSVPDNLYIIATMNTADRSLQNLDYAVRRRFSFVKVESQNPIPLNKNEVNNTYYKILGDNAQNPKTKFFLKALFEQVKKDVEASVARGINPEDIMPGISYFIVNAKEDDNDKYDENHLEYKIKYELIPLLQEYIKDGMFSKRNSIDGFDGSLIQIIKKNDYCERLKNVIEDQQE